MVNAADLALDDSPLPFGGEAAPPPPAAGDLAREPSSDIDGTAFLNGPIDLGTTLPFDAPSPAKMLTLQQYVSLCAECRAQPQELSAIRARYGITSPEQHQALDAHWAAQLRANPELKREHEQLVAQYAEWARTRGR